MNSMFDGWTEKAIGTRDDGMGGHCVLGWLDILRKMYPEMRREIFIRSSRLADWVRIHAPHTKDAYNPRNNTTRSSGIEGPLAAYNNMFEEATPQRFRELDLEVNGPWCLLIDDTAATDEVENL